MWQVVNALAATAAAAAVAFSGPSTRLPATTTCGNSRYQVLNLLARLKRFIPGAGAAAAAVLRQLLIEFTIFGRGAEACPKAQA